MLSTCPSAGPNLLGTGWRPRTKQSVASKGDKRELLLSGNALGPLVCLLAVRGRRHVRSLAGFAGTLCAVLGGVLLYECDIRRLCQVRSRLATVAVTGIKPTAHSLGGGSVGVCGLSLLLDSVTQPTQ